MCARNCEEAARARCRRGPFQSHPITQGLLHVPFLLEANGPVWSEKRFPLPTMYFRFQRGERTEETHCNDPGADWVVVMKKVRHGLVCDLFEGGANGTWQLGMKHTEWGINSDMWLFVLPTETWKTGKCRFRVEGGKVMMFPVCVVWRCTVEGTARCANMKAEEESWTRDKKTYYVNVALQITKGGIVGELPNAAKHWVYASLSLYRIRITKMFHYGWRRSWLQDYLKNSNVCHQDANQKQTTVSE